MSSEELFDDAVPNPLSPDLSPASLGSTPIEFSGVVGGIGPSEAGDGDRGVVVEEESSGTDREGEVREEAENSKSESSDSSSLLPSIPSDCDLLELDEDLEELLKQPKARKRRGQGRFKKGVLKQRKAKGHRRYKDGMDANDSKSSEQSENTEGQSEDYLNVVDGTLDGLLTTDSENVSGTSGTETLPSENNESVQQEGEENKAASKTVSHRQKKRSLARKKKFAWKKENTKQEPLGTLGGEDESYEVMKSDVSVSVHEKEIYRDALESSVSKEESLVRVANYLKFTVDASWHVALLEDTICLNKVTNPSNPYVEKSITWDGKKTNFLVHNHQLPDRSPLWGFKKPDPLNYGAVADYLTALSNSILAFEVCGGIQSHEHLWETFGKDSLSERLVEPACIRSQNCSLLLLYPGKCTNCRLLQRKILEQERQRLRTAARENVDRDKINARYLQRDEIANKIKRIQKEKKLAKQTVARYRRRIDQLLQRVGENIDRGLGGDFVKIMNENTDKMTEMEKIFWEQQSKALSRRNASKSMRWHPAMIRLALHLRMLSPAAFDFMRGIISLPSQRRLFDYSQFTDAKEGVQEDLLQQFNLQIQEKCTEEYQKYFSLLLDEMSIRSDLVYDSRSGELIGFTNLTSLEEELATLEAEIQGKIPERRLAKKVLVFMLKGCANDIIFVPAIYSTDDLSAAQLYTRTWEVIYATEETGAKVLCVIFDGASVNRKFIRLHFNMGDKDIMHVTINSASGESRSLYFILDLPHLIKTFRNCLASSFSHQNTRALCKDEQLLSWKAIEALFEIIQQYKYKDTKLTKAHVFLTSFSCMRVYLAAQIFSNSLCDALEKYKDISPLKEEYSPELVKFLRLMNRCFDCLNGGSDSKKKLENPDLLEYTSSTDSRFSFLKEEFLGYLSEWQQFVENREGNFSKDQRSRMIISHQSLEGMKITINSSIEVIKFLLDKGAPSVSARKFNQDNLEQYFSELRRVRGADNNPTVKQVLHSRLSLHAQGQMVEGGKRGNTEVLKRKMEVDDTPLAVRKRPKQE